MIDCIRNLFVHSLLPPAMLRTFDFVKETVEIPLLSVSGVSSADKNKEKRDQSGIFSTISQLLTGGFDDEDELGQPSKKQVENQSIAFECINSCRIEDLFSDSR